MTFVHDDPEFVELIRIVGAARRIQPVLVEKDYWVTHVLWSVQRAGLECWFKGGTSLSKGYKLIERFSEDLDLKLGAGTAEGVAPVTNWKSEGKGHVTARKAFFEGVARVLHIDRSRVELVETDDAWHDAHLRIHYPKGTRDPMPDGMTEYVVIEAGSARVVPSVQRDLESFVHEELTQQGKLGEFVDNRPRAVECTHPVVTLIEKLDAIAYRFPREDVEATKFVRHYEDSARVIAAIGALPPLDRGVVELAAEMLEQRQIRRLAVATDPAFNPGDSARWHQVRRAHAETAVMYFGAAPDLDAACARIRAWLQGGLEPDRA